jgi:hypothetical protein
LRRYIATKEAIDASSSTTRTVCASGVAIRASQDARTPG